MSKPRHLVFGAGLIGGHLAGALISRGFDTSVVGRDAARNKMKNGITISDYLNNSTQTTSPSFVSADTNENSFDVIWLTVKCTAVVDAVPELRKLLSSNTVIICCQNGLGSDLALRTAFPDNKTLTAVAGYNVAEPNDGHYHRSTEGELVMQYDQDSQLIVKQLDCPLLPCRHSDNILAEQWAKLQLNLTNPVNALSDIPVKAMTEDLAFRRIVATLMSEMLMVCDAMQLELPKITSIPAHWIPRVLRLPNFVFKRLAQKMLAIDPTARLSMWWDLSNNKNTEIDFINGAVLAQANILGLHCPYNQKILELIKDVEAGKLEIGFSGTQLQQTMHSK